MPGYVRHHRYKELFKYPGSSVWWCFLPNPRGGKALRESTGHRDDVAAHNEYLRRVRGSLDGAPSKPQRSLNTALQMRLEWLESNQKSNDPTRKKLAKDTISFYRKKSGVLVRVLGPNLLLSEITPETLRRYIQTRTEEGTKGTTIARELTALSMAVRLAHKDGIECTLVRDMKPEDFKAIYVPKKRWLSRVEVKAVLKELPKDRAAIVAFIVATGATFPSEVYRVRTEDVKPSKKNPTVHIRGTKRETRDRTFVVPRDRREYFKMAVPFVPFRRWTNANRDLLRVAEKLKIDAFCPTDFRRTFAKWLALAGVPYELAYPLMGHADDRMLKQVYGKREATDVAPLVDAVLRKAKRSGVSRG